MRPPRALRSRLVLIITAGVGLFLAAIVFTSALVLNWELSRDARDAVRARADVELATVRVEGERVIPAREAGVDLEARAWVFEGRRLLAGPRVSADLNRAAAELALADGTDEREVVVPGTSTRLLALPIVEDGERVGTVVAGVALAPYDRIARRALIGSIALALIILAAVVAASSVILRAALRPVSRMTRDAAAASEGDLEMRFALGPPYDEITELAATLDALLDRLAAGMRHERRLTAEISHELRTPLAQIRAEIDLALRRPRDGDEYRAALRTISEGVDRIGATIEALLSAARSDAGEARGTSAAREIADATARACAYLSIERGIALGVDGDPGIRAGIDLALGVRILQPLVENACRYAEGSVRIAVEELQKGVAIEVRDDGPGVPADLVDEIFTSGWRGADPVDAGGAGLGLALSRRLARAAGGDVRATSGPGGRFSVRLPSA